MPAKSAFDPSSATPASVLREDGIEYGFIGKLQGLKYEYRPDIRDRAALEANFRHRFEVLNQKQLGNTLWGIADQLCGAMDADDFREPASTP